MKIRSATKNFWNDTAPEERKKILLAYQKQVAIFEEKADKIFHEHLIDAIRHGHKRDENNARKSLTTTLAFLSSNCEALREWEYLMQKHGK